MIPAPKPAPTIFFSPCFDQISGHQPGQQPRQPGTRPAPARTISRNTSRWSAVFQAEQLGMPASSFAGTYPVPGPNGATARKSHDGRKAGASRLAGVHVACATGARAGSTASAGRPDEEVLRKSGERLPVLAAPRGTCLPLFLGGGWREEGRERRGRLHPSQPGDWFGLVPLACPGRRSGGRSHLGGRRLVPAPAAAVFEVWAPPLRTSRLSASVPRLRRLSLLPGGTAHVEPGRGQGRQVREDSPGA